MSACFSIRRADGSIMCVTDQGNIEFLSCTEDNRSVLYHRVRGPAIIKSTGHIQYAVHDQIHRDDGPAVIRPNMPNMSDLYYIDGMRVSSTEYFMKYGVL